jgi:diadenosine tetraphosphate (Ap4A) HIT family hydrolase
MSDTTTCHFCLRKPDMEQRKFYEKGNWFAILAAPPNLRGHTVLARIRFAETCPQALDTGTLSGLDAALADVAGILRAYYQPVQLVFSSLRVTDPHVHLHLFPVSQKSEIEWRTRKGVGYEKGRFHEFLGDAERAANRELQVERDEKGWTKEEQRLQHASLLASDVVKLKQLVRS